MSQETGLKEVLWGVCSAPPRGLIVITRFSRAENVQLAEGHGGAELHRRQLEPQQTPAARIHYRHCEY